MTDEPAFEPALVSIRPLGHADIERMLEIERLSYTLPWSREMFTSEFDRGDGVHLAACAADSADLVAYIVVSRLAEVWHVMNLAVHPSLRRMGVGRMLLERFLAETAHQQMRGYTLEVRVGNKPALELYGGYGFTPHGLRRGYYVDNGEDAVVMWRAPDGAPPGWQPQL